MTEKLQRYVANKKNPHFTFLEIDQDSQIEEICARWPLLAELCACARAQGEPEAVETHDAVRQEERAMS